MSIASAISDEAARQAGDVPSSVPANLTRWYAEMRPCWLDIEPPLRRRLVLRTHRWIVDSVFSRASPAALLDDLRPGGTLPVALGALLPADEIRRWQPWIRLLMHDLRRSLASPPSPPTEAWCRWMLLIPYSVPVPPSRRHAVEMRPLLNAQ